MVHILFYHIAIFQVFRLDNWQTDKTRFFLISYSLIVYQWLYKRMPFTHEAILRLRLFLSTALREEKKADRSGNENQTK